MIRDGYQYALASLIAAVVIGYFAMPWLAAVPILFGAFCLWFFRDPEREIPAAPGMVVSCADGKVTEVIEIDTPTGRARRISIFLSVFNVHVNRAPIAGEIVALEMRKGKYLNAMNPASAEENEQAICTLRSDDGVQLVFKMIAGLIARRIVFQRQLGERMERGERVGLIKFGSRCDVILPLEAEIVVKVSDKVSGGSSVLAKLPVKAAQS